VNFINRRCSHIPIIMNGKIIPHSQTAKYLGMTLDASCAGRCMLRKKEKSLA